LEKFFTSKYIPKNIVQSSQENTMTGFCNLKICVFSEKLLLANTFQKNIVLRRMTNNASAGFCNSKNLFGKYNLKRHSDNKPKLIKHTAGFCDLKNVHIFWLKNIV
jgi:hypothetical protein